MRFIPALLLVVCIGCSRNEQSADFDALIEKLCAGSSQEEMVTARQQLLDAGNGAFPALLARLTDGTPAHQNLQGAFTTPERLGNVCFDLLQYQIEGAWPKSMRHYHVLNMSNVADWLIEHRSKTLDEMRLIAIQQAISKAHADIEADVEAAHARDLIEFLRDRKRELGGGMASDAPPKPDETRFDL